MKLSVSSFAIAAAVAIAMLPNCGNAQSESGLKAGISWYGVLKDGLKEAKETNRPILLVSAAPQCAGVPGMW